MILLAKLHCKIYDRNCLAMPLNETLSAGVGNYSHSINKRLNEPIPLN